MARERKIDMVILGLLSHEDLTGYDIKKRIDGAISFFWKGSFGNIYPALRDMQAQGLLKKSNTSTGGREKFIYHLTDQGKAVLKDWLAEESASNELKYETLLKLFCGGVGGSSVSVHTIEVFEREIEKDLKMLKSYCEILKKAQDDEDHVYYYLTASFGVETYEAYLRWCAAAKDMLRNKKKLRNR